MFAQFVVGHYNNQHSNTATMSTHLHANDDGDDDDDFALFETSKGSSLTALKFQDTEITISSSFEFLESLANRKRQTNHESQTQKENSLNDNNTYIENNKNNNNNTAIPRSDEEDKNAIESPNKRIRLDVSQTVKREQVQPSKQSNTDNNDTMDVRKENEILSTTSSDKANKIDIKDDTSWNSGAENEDDEVSDDGNEEERKDSVLVEPLASTSITATIELARRRAFLSKISAAANEERWDLHRYNEEGRALTQKEVFRELSHKFHGIAPSIGKRDKRLKREVKERKQRDANADVQGKADRLSHITESLQRPFIVIDSKTHNPGV